LWARLVEAAGRASPFTRTYLLEAHPVGFRDGLFTIGFDPEFEDHLGLVDNARNHSLLQTKLLELGHSNVQIRFIKAEAPADAAAKPVQAAPASPPSAINASAAAGSYGATVPDPSEAGQLSTALAGSVPLSQSDFRNDPLIQKALQIFKGQIVEVRA